MSDYICPVCNGPKQRATSRTCMSCVGLEPGDGGIASYRPRKSKPKTFKVEPNVAIIPICPKCATNAYAFGWYNNKVRCIACKEVYANH